VEERLQTDILILGGGAAGLNAALSAREAGQDVVIMDKAVIERSGHFAGGIDHFGAYLNTGPAWDTREAYLDFTARSARGATNIDVVEKIYCDQLQTAIERFDAVGCTLRQPDNTFFRTQSYGQPGPWWINFNGKRLKPLIGGPRAKARLAFGHPPIGRLSSFALTHLTGSAHAPPIKCVRADCDSRHEKKIKNHFLPMPAILAAQQPAVGKRGAQGRLPCFGPRGHGRHSHQ